jgi:hypothetical protein
MGIATLLLLGDPPDAKGAVHQEFEMEVKGNVENEVLEPRLFLGPEMAPFKLGKMRVPSGGTVLNPMHLLNRVPGMRPGRHWRVPLLDPLADTNAIGAFIPKSLAVTELEASVEPVMLKWGHEEVTCYCIEYRKPGEADVRARTWVRRRDGLVLQQEAGVGGLALIIQRVRPLK